MAYRWNMSTVGTYLLLSAHWLCCNLPYKSKRTTSGEWVCGRHWNTALWFCALKLCFLEKVGLWIHWACHTFQNFWLYNFSNKLTREKKKCAKVRYSFLSKYIKVSQLTLFSPFLFKPLLLCYDHLCILEHSPEKEVKGSLGIKDTFAPLNYWTIGRKLHIHGGQPTMVLLSRHFSM